MFFQSWTSVGQTILTGVIAYVALVGMLRVSGKRTLAKMNAFDLVVTVALGSTLSTILVSRQVPLTDGLVALALLVTLQFVVAWTSVRWRAFERTVKGDPSLLLYRGAFRTGEMRRQRVSEEEIRAATRAAGLAKPTDAGAVILETDGSFSVVKQDAVESANDPVLPGLPAVSGQPPG
jgi:uncharacterized membrane protein YcaP (DUF421 family)